MLSKKRIAAEKRDAEKKADAAAGQSLQWIVIIDHVVATRHASVIFVEASNRFSLLSPTIIWYGLYDFAKTKETQHYVAGTVGHGCVDIARASIWPPIACYSKNWLHAKCLKTWFAVCYFVSWWFGKCRWRLGIALLSTNIFKIMHCIAFYILISHHPTSSTS